MWFKERIQASFALYQRLQYSIQREQKYIVICNNKLMSPDDERLISPSSRLDTCFGCRVMDVEDRRIDGQTALYTYID